MVVISQRHVPSDPSAYNKAHVAASDYMMNHVVGTMAAFQTTDREDRSLVHDVQWWDSRRAFFAHTDPRNPVMQQKLQDWVTEYDWSKPFKGHVFGGWNAEVFPEKKHELILIWQRHT